MKLGLHISIAGSLMLAVERARKRNCETIQIFAGNPRNWGRWNPDKHDAADFRAACAQYGISPVVVHAPYLVNLGAPDEKIYDRSKGAIANGLRVCDIIGAPYYVVHTGSSVTSSKPDGMRRVGVALAELIAADDSGVAILLENMAGAGSSLGVTFEELAEIIEIAGGGERLGICFDTCHAFAGGYDLATKTGVEGTLRALDTTLGMARVGLIHANDSKYPLGTAHDRHAAIGEGYIGNAGFDYLLNHPLLTGKPVILETPRQTVADDLKNISVLRDIKGNRLRKTENILDYSRNTQI
ncbi:MAG: deoxyribonuclease IV [Actinobacteria bacterium]|nr:deoxyribonuclease IV [Actinomycetota bacterium]